MFNGNTKINTDFQFLGRSISIIFPIAETRARPQTASLKLFEKGLQEQPYKNRYGNNDQDVVDDFVSVSDRVGHSLQFYNQRE